jgi:hypothetical protein
MLSANPYLRLPARPCLGGYFVANKDKSTFEKLPKVCRNNFLIVPIGFQSSWKCCLLSADCCIFNDLDAFTPWGRY